MGRNARDRAQPPAWSHEKSTEVSNQIFPLHKHYVYRQDSGVSLTATRVKYEQTFSILNASVGQADPVSYVYDAIWSSDEYAANNGERMAFYMQVVHTSADLPQLSSGWDVYTLMYLQERLFTEAIVNGATWTSQKDGLGFSTYGTPPTQMDGNDFMLISTSFITGRDQRPLFSLWGITFSGEASSQVDAFGFSAVAREMFVSVDTNADPHPTPVPINGTTAWPL